MFYCGVCDTYMRPVLGIYGQYRRCPKYEFKNRNGSEPVCMNRISVSDMAILYEELESLQEQGYLNKGTAGVVEHLEYEIADVAPDYIKVWVINSKKIA